METGAPEPVVQREGDRAWVAYLARDPDFPGWEHPSVTEYLDAHPGEPFGVLRFDGVTDCALGPPSDERLHEHPLYGRGLDFYEFHRVRSPQEAGRWIVTFHDETLEVHAQSAFFFPMVFAATRDDAITCAKAAG
jgi:hypothetical protein